MARGETRRGEVDLDPRGAARERPFGTCRLCMALLVVGCALLASSCSRAYVTALAPNAGVGNLKVFGTDIVPFKFQEIAYISVSGMARRDRGVQLCTRRLRDLAKERGADAILNFRVDLVGTDWVNVSGVAVNIVR